MGAFVGRAGDDVKQRWQDSAIRVEIRYSSQEWGLLFRHSRFSDVPLAAAGAVQDEMHALSSDGLVRRNSLLCTLQAQVEAEHHRSARFEPCLRARAVAEHGRLQFLVDPPNLRRSRCFTNPHPGFLDGAGAHYGASSTLFEVVRQRQHEPVPPRDPP